MSSFHHGIPCAIACSGDWACKISTPRSSIQEIYRGRRGVHRGYARLTSTLPIWQGEVLKDSTQALRYVPQPIRPEASLTTFLIAHCSSSYSDHSGQRYYTLGILSDVAIGHFSRSYFDYTRLSIGGSVSIVEHLSRFSFDRAVDLGLFHVSWTQQLAGPPTPGNKYVLQYRWSIREIWQQS